MMNPNSVEFLARDRIADHRRAADRTLLVPDRRDTSRPRAERARVRGVSIIRIALAVLETFRG